MAENVTIFGDIADKFDALVAYDEKLLDQYVEEQGYSIGSMALASTAMAFMTFSKGFVDVGRVGNGILVEGGWKGIGKDALRVLTVAGGGGAVIGRVSKLMRLTQVGNTCAPVAQTNAIRLAGQRFFMTLEELATKAGLNLQNIAAVGSGSAEYTGMIAAMQRMGIAVRTLASGSTMTLQRAFDLIKANPGGVVTFSILRAGSGMGHRLYATYSRLGGFVVRDPNSVVRTFRTVADIEKAFGAGTIVRQSPMIFIPNTFLTTAASAAETASGLGELFVQVVPIVEVLARDDETAVQALEVRENMAKSGGPPPLMKLSSLGAAGKYHTVVPGDWLSKLAKRYYGNMHKWPVIFEANRKTIGRNPDVIRVNQRLFIPNLPHARIIAANALPGQASMVA
jgi:LysM repeat protein